MTVDVYILCLGPMAVNGHIHRSVHNRLSSTDIRRVTLYLNRLLELQLKLNFYTACPANILNLTCFKCQKDLSVI